MSIQCLQPTDSDNGIPYSPLKIRCRHIAAGDFEALADLLATGFPRRARSYWTQALYLLSQRPALQGYPRYGYMLECDGAAVGVMLLLFSKARHSQEVRCNGSSWYVAPAFRSFGVSLVTRTLKLRATHTNVSPAPNVAPIFEALGYRKFCKGLFAAAPSLAGPWGRTGITRISPTSNPGSLAPADDLQMLRDHARFGCVSLWCETQDEGCPFIFRRRFVKALPGIPAAQLVFCDSMEQFGRLAGPIGRYLALHGMPFVIAPSDGPIPGLNGKYFDNKPMYFLGSQPPPPGDLAYTEMALFGI